jgi:hypothetical protein
MVVFVTPETPRPFTVLAITSPLISDNALPVMYSSIWASPPYYSSWFLLPTQRSAK